VVRREAIKVRGSDWSAEDQAAYSSENRDQYETQGHPSYATARLWDDGIIDPARTREVLAQALRICAGAPSRRTRFGVFRM
jgi:3-methylcrotonyl-CoA carboxylase beta subunit